MYLRSFYRADLSLFHWPVDTSAYKLRAFWGILIFFPDKLCLGVIFWVMDTWHMIKWRLFISIFLLKHPSNNPDTWHLKLWNLSNDAYLSRWHTFPTNDLDLGNPKIVYILESLSFLQWNLTLSHYWITDMSTRPWRFGRFVWNSTCEWRI